MPRIESVDERQHAVDYVPRIAALLFGEQLDQVQREFKLGRFARHPAISLGQQHNHRHTEDGSRNFLQ
jgi:hypothetical protein